nr:serine/arginine repetitive matrix-like protein [Ipomoea batatas]
MGAVEVLRPQDALQKQFDYRDSGFVNSPMNFSSSPPETKGNFMVGQVRILKRGEGLVGDTAPLKKIGEKVERVESESVFGKQPETTPKKKFNIADFYAGSACDSSPPPSSLPVPGFFKKKTILVENNDYATCDLRRLLRLDLS